METGLLRWRASPGLAHLATRWRCSHGDGRSPLHSLAVALRELVLGGQPERVAAVSPASLDVGTLCISERLLRGERVIWWGCFLHCPCTPHGVHAQSLLDAAGGGRVGRGGTPHASTASKQDGLLHLWILSEG